MNSEIEPVCAECERRIVDHSAAEIFVCLFGVSFEVGREMANAMADSIEQKLWGEYDETERDSL